MGWETRRGGKGRGRKKRRTRGLTAVAESTEDPPPPIPAPPDVPPGGPPELLLVLEAAAPEVETVPVATAIEDMAEEEDARTDPTALAELDEEPLDEVPPGPPADELIELVDEESVYVLYPTILQKIID